MPMYACQLWSKYTQASMKRLRAAYNNAYRIMHYIPRNLSVRPHQVSHCVRTFDAVLRNDLHRFFIRCTSSSKFFIRCLQMSDAFYKSSFFLNYSQARRQNLAAEGAKNQKRGHIFKFQYWMYAATGGPNVIWGALKRVQPGCVRAPSVWDRTSGRMGGLSSMLTPRQTAKELLLPCA